MGDLSDTVGKRHVLDSVVISNPACSYCVGVVHEGKMTLTPIRSINQLRPDFTDYDKFRSSKFTKATSSTAVPEVDAKGDAGSDSGAEEAKIVPAQTTAVATPIRVEFKAGEAPVVQEEEHWVRMDYYDQASQEAKDIYQEQVIWPVAAAAKAVLGRMTSERQVEAIVRHFVVVSYVQQLRKRLPQQTLRSIGEEQLLTHLRKCALLVAGNWVLKSTHAGFTGLDECARDLILVLLHKKKGSLEAADISKWTSVFGNPIATSVRDEILRSLTVRDQAKGVVRLKNAPDAEFLKHFPEIVKEFEEFWQKHQVTTTQRVQTERASKPNRQQQSQRAAEGHQKRNMSRLATEIRTILTTGAVTLPELRREIQKKNTTTVIRDEQLLSALQGEELECQQVRDLWVLGTTGNELNDKFREVVHGIFRGKDTVSNSEILGEYEAKLGKKPSLSSFVMRNLIREVAEKLDNKRWVVKGLMADGK